MVFITDGSVQSRVFALKSADEFMATGVDYPDVAGPFACDVQAQGVTAQATAAYPKTAVGVAAATSISTFGNAVAVIVNTDGVVTWTAKDGIGDTLSGSKILSAGFALDLIGACHLYFVDDGMQLWATHQAMDERLLPGWTTAVPIDSGILSVAVDTYPADAPALFAVDGAIGALRLDIQPSPSGAWVTSQVLQPSQEALEVTRFRTEVFVCDASGAPVPYHHVLLKAPPGGTACEVWTGGAVWTVSDKAQTALSTDVSGRLTFATLVTNGISTPDIVVSVEGCADLPVQPALSVHTYLTGSGTLNPTNPADPSGSTGTNMPFDAKGSQLAAAKLWPSGETLAPGAADATLAGVAAQAIQTTAQVGTKGLPAGMVGYSASFDKDEGPSFTPHTSDDLPTAHLEFTQRCSDFGSFVHGAEACAGDIWTGIKHGTVKIVHALVDAANSVAHLAVKIGDEIKSGISLALDGLEQAGHFITGVFAAVEADIEKVVDWLKALFDFSAILNTMKAYQQVLEALPANISGALNALEKRADGWFKKQEQTVDGAIAGWKKNFEGKNFSDLPNWQPQNQGPSDDKVAVKDKSTGGASASDCVSNVHHNWFWDKLHAYMHDNAGAPGDKIEKDLQTAVENFATNIEKGGADFEKGLEDLFQGLKDTLASPTKFQDSAVTDFLDALSKLTGAGLSFCDAAVDAVAGLTDAVMAVLEAMLTTPLDIPEISSLWSWLARKAGTSPTPLTMGSLLSLAAAFPSTIVYKLIAGVDAQPFPDGTLGRPSPISAPQPSVKAQMLSSSAIPAAALGASPPGTAPAEEHGSKTGFGKWLYKAHPDFVLASAILQVIYVVPANPNDALGSDSPQWLGIGTMVLGALVVCLKTDWPDWDQNDFDYLAAGLLIVGLLYLFLQAASTGSEQRTTVMAPVMSVLGLGEYVIAAFGNEEDPVMYAASLLVPIASVFQFMKLPQLRKTPQAKLAAAGISVAMDFISYVCGGTLKVVDAVEHL